jgi:hypothetical protein
MKPLVIGLLIVALSAVASMSASALSRELTQERQDVIHQLSGRFDGLGWRWLAQ